MRLKTLLLAPLALAATAVAQPAAAQQLDLTENEMATVARIAMPAAFRSLQVKCSPVLSASAYMFASGESLHRKLTTASQSAAPGASRILASVAARSNPAMSEILAGMPAETLLPFVNEMVAGMLTREIEPDQCATIDRVLELIEPLPAENVADLLALAYAQSPPSQSRTAR